MKKMSKAQIIAVLLNKLKDRNILEKVRSIEEIELKLTQILLEEIKYDVKEQASLTMHSNGLEQINFNIDLMNQLSLPQECEEQLIIHELLHALFSEYKTEDNIGYYKTGFQTTTFDLKKSSKKTYNTMLTEGMTDVLAMKIVGIDEKLGYEEEREFYQLCSCIVGKDVMLEKYADKNIEDYFIGNPYNLFFHELVEKYGVVMGTQINEGMKNILALSDELVISKKNSQSNENEGKLQNTKRQQIHDEFLYLVEKIINHESDFTKKIEIVKEYMTTYLGKEVASKILEQLAEDDEIDIHRKLTIFREFRESENSYISNSVTTKLLFATKGCEQLTAEDKLKEYLYLYEGSWDTGTYCTIYQLYLESGKISQDLFDKREMFNCSIPLEGIKTIEQIDNVLKESEYCKLGNYYMLLPNNTRESSSIYNYKGNLKIGKYLCHPDKSKVVEQLTL